MFRTDGIVYHERTNGVPNSISSTKYSPVSPSFRMPWKGAPPLALLLCRNATVVNCNLGWSSRSSYTDDVYAWAFSYNEAAKRGYFILIKRCSLQTSKISGTEVRACVIEAPYARYGSGALCRINIKQPGKRFVEKKPGGDTCSPFLRDSAGRVLGCLGILRLLFVLGLHV